MSNWYTEGAQPFCERHGFVYHSCCKECRWNYSRDDEPHYPCGGCLKVKEPE